ncbi:MAG: hypothetical protein GY805_18755, partial [Chloroflexi bacterium]|nr:hypothetical protein [Chloroflexota bacterium]
HSDLFDVEFWHKTQSRITDGNVIDIFPYRQRQRLSQ